MDEKLLDARGKKEIEDKIATLLDVEREFAENSPMPPPEFAETGVYCTGDACHTIAAQWERPLAEVTPPKSKVQAVWKVEGFGQGKSSGGAHAPIHFGDTAGPHRDAGKKIVKKKFAVSSPRKATHKRKTGR